jgi:hypothetical protein
VSNPFSAEQTAKAIHASLDDALAAVPEGKSNVVLVDGTYSRETGAAARALWLRKTDSGWNVLLEGRVDSTHGIAGKVATAKSW